MIEISAKLIRKENAAYVTGEKVECFIELNNISSTLNGTNDFEHLAWGSVQIHCYKCTNSKTEDDFDYQNVTALGNMNSHGNLITSTKAKILFCDLKLKIGENKKYFFSEFIPRSGPPTYRGYNINYFYKLVIATQRVKSKVNVLAVPFRVLPVSIIAKREEYTSVETQENFKPTNPFLDKNEVTELELSWNHLTNLTARRMPKFYKITNKRGYVGRFCLFKNDFKLGEDIVGTMDFTECEVRCVQFSVKLQREELLISNKPKKLENWENQNVQEHSQNTFSGPGKLTTYTNHHEFCLSMIQTQMIIPIPLTVTPTFNTKDVDVRWRLHFEFVTSNMIGTENSNYEDNWIAPSDIPVETMIWDLPITIWSTSPLQIWTPPNKFSLILK
ncbi:RAB6A-GEF complex partner protein 2 [Condylostylus longicornis]|uniref:RAB6A-GEF complex partner protein 2 n=1 Tax=Condylostylus longicornis TaxID=2530218 RepID=UPI00244DA753|nr:RAB6A-GEF complex partner protein 2 [Condylostylus longicornis]